MYKVIATTKQVLQLIYDAGYIKSKELSDQFGYSYDGAIKKILRLHQRGLIQNKIYGKWNLTDEGLRRLEYYGRKDKETARN